MAFDQDDGTRSGMSSERISLIIAAVILIAGPQLPTQSYLTPRSGVGYIMGIIGGSMVLAQIFYALRKRVPGFGFLGSVQMWFRLHMLLGTVGPIFILIHCGFSFGATNSNVALICLLLVSGSGIIGRYFYSKVHYGLYGRKATLTELQTSANALKKRFTNVPMLPELLTRLEHEEDRLTDAQKWGALLAPTIIGSRARSGRRRINRYVKAAIKAAAANSSTVAAQRKNLERNVMAYVENRLQTTRKVAEFRVYERLFSLWHLFHVPMFFMVIAAGIVHVVSVHVY